MEIRAVDQAKEIILSHFGERSPKIIVDATCGNGNDTCFLAENFKQSKVFGFDIQKQAIEKTELRLKEIGLEAQIQQANFKDFDKLLPNTVDLVVYNLGYLPGSSHLVLSQAEDTLASVKASCDRLAVGGLVLVVCYPHNPEECRLLEEWGANLTGEYNAFILKRINRKNPPYILIITRD